MWNNTDDGGFGRNQPGGGFLNTTISSPSTGEKKKGERLTNVVPCTIAQIHQMSENDENLKVGSLTAKIITFVGIVESVDVQTTKITYMVNDCTGPSIEVQIWVGENDDVSKRVNVVQENKYARITGAVRSMKGKRHVIAFNISPIKDLNEVTMHIAEVIHTSMAVETMDKQAMNGGAVATFDSTNTFSGGMNTTSSTDTFGNDSNYASKLTRPQQLVLQAVNNCKDEQGINVCELYNNLKSLNRQSIQDALEFLSNEGHIYSTIDENHYKSTDSV